MKTGAPSGNSGSPPLLAMIFLSVSASSSEGPPGSWGASVSDGGGGILRSKLPGNGGKITLPGGNGGRIVGVVGEGILKVGAGVLGSGGAVGAVGAVKGSREGGRGEKNPGGGIPGGMAGKLMLGGAGGKGGANLGVRGTGTGATSENGVLEGFGGIVCGKRPAWAGVNCTKPTEPGIFLFEEFPPFIKFEIVGAPTPSIP